MFELLVLNALYPGLIAGLVVGGAIIFALYWALRTAYEIVMFPFRPLLAKLEQREKERAAAHEKARAERQAKFFSAEYAREQRDARAKAREQRRIEAGTAAVINGEVCTIKRMEGKQYVKVRGEWQRYC